MDDIRLCLSVDLIGAFEIIRLRCKFAGRQQRHTSRSDGGIHVQEHPCRRSPTDALLPGCVHGTLLPGLVRGAWCGEVDFHLGACQMRPGQCRAKR